MSRCISRINWTTLDCSASQARLPYNGSRLHLMRFESISAPYLISDVVYALWLQSFAGRRSERVRSSHFLRPLSSQRVFADLGGCCGTLGRLHEGLYGSITLFDHFFVSMDYLSQYAFRYRIMTSIFADGEDFGLLKLLLAPKTCFVKVYVQ